MELIGRVNFTSTEQTRTPPKCIREGYTRVESRALFRKTGAAPGINYI